MDRSLISNTNRVVIKFGTNILTNDEGDVSLSRVYSFIEDVSKLRKEGKEVILVTSGAVGLGKSKLGLESTDATALKQACAAVGQGRLMSIYEAGFDKYGLAVAQILLTEDDFSQRKRYLSLRMTLNKLLELKVIPIINQNDTVSTIELDELYDDMQVCFSDNDKLSALVASELDADLLVILSDVEGLYDSNPKTNSNAKIIPVVENVTDEILNLGEGASSGGRGGMRTKLEAARLVTRSGGTVLVANGKTPSVINQIFSENEIGTIFLPHQELLSGKKRWIGYATNILGKIIVNYGAKKAILEKESSLLPIGVVEIRNEFKKGEVVSILDENEKEIARGMVNYNSDDCKKLIGAHSDDISKILGYKNYDAVITRDNITVLE
ncbi:MAG TPA: glutamate 5-kinase [Candidatus Gastranaerophilaceae bacterium]|nr:glutamate 5-kinase [Candidatus Gastranaerophilaceae bacterium]HPT41862.1 glutamate 5-kinase [Candidatus Gastranaerophilaceae bacterium]